MKLRGFGALSGLCLCGCLIDRQRVTHKAVTPTAPPVSATPARAAFRPPPSEPCPSLPPAPVGSFADAKAAEASSGRLPPDVIQQIVRASYGRFRHCYEAGLARKPKLQGRVTVRFVIDRGGRVPCAADASIRAGTAAEADEHEGSIPHAESPFPDAQVVDCMLKEYRKLVFPKPEGGSVTVVYPILFSPG